MASWRTVADAGRRRTTRRSMKLAAHSTVPAPTANSPQTPRSNTSARHAQRADCGGLRRSAHAQDAVRTDCADFGRKAPTRPRHTAQPATAPTTKDVTRRCVNQRPRPHNWRPAVGYRAGLLGSIAPPARGIHGCGWSRGGSAMTTRAVTTTTTTRHHDHPSRARPHSRDGRRRGERRPVRRAIATSRRRSTARAGVGSLSARRHDLDSTRCRASG